MPQARNRRGLIFVLVGPAAVGKNTLMHRALDRLGEEIRQLPTATTRPIRPNEEEGKQHYFMDRARFEQLIKDGMLLEYQTHYGNLYGVLRNKLEDALARPEDVIADIEVLGASEVKKAYPQDSILIFVSPPDVATLEQRITNRNMDTPEEIARRFARTPFEMQFAPICDYLIVNNDLELATKALLGIIRAEKSRRDLREMTMIEARIYHGGNILVADTTADQPVLPTLNANPGEYPTDTVCRLARLVGAEDLQLNQHSSGVEVDAAAPDAFTLDSMDAAPCLRLQYTCRFIGDPASIKPGWKWQPAEQKP